MGGYYWRIIRINGDGTIRLIYNGNSTTTTGTGTQISTGAFNNTYSDNMYVGLKYTQNEVHGLETDSTILTALNTWYQQNLVSYADDIDTNAGFCNDRYPSTSSSSSNGLGGTGAVTTYYAAYIRLTINKTPMLNCQDSSDLFTVSSSNRGNKSLTYPIGLITADEVAYAGGVVDSNNRSYYLYTGQAYWTVSPYRFYSGNAYVFLVDMSGYLSSKLDYGSGIRPVINLKADITLTGSGTATDPYVVEGAE